MRITLGLLTGGKIWIFHFLNSNKYKTNKQKEKQNFHTYIRGTSIEHGIVRQEYLRYKFKKITHDRKDCILDQIKLKT